MVLVVAHCSPVPQSMPTKGALIQEVAKLRQKLAANLTSDQYWLQGMNKHWEKQWSLLVLWYWCHWEEDSSLGAYGCTKLNKGLEVY